MKSYYTSVKNHFPSFSTYSAFALIFCLVPYRVLGILHFQIVVKAFTMVFCFLAFFYVLKINKMALSYILESVILQYFFFTMLRFENLIWNMSSFMRYFFLLIFGFNLGAWPSQSGDPTFYYMLFIFLYTFYNQLKILFLNPNFEASTYHSSDSGNESAKDLTWEDIINSISSISLCFFGRPVLNKLGKEKGSVAFPHITKRYMFSRATAAIKSNPELATAATAIGGAIGFGVSEMIQNKRHAENVALAEQSIAEAKRANAEAKRANDLREVELKITSSEEYKSAYSIGNPNQEVQARNLTNSIQEKPEATNLSCFYEETFSSVIFKCLDWFF